MVEGFSTQSRTGTPKELRVKRGRFGYDPYELIESYGGKKQTTFSYRTNLNPLDVDLHATVYTDAEQKEGDTGHKFWTHSQEFVPMNPIGNYYLVPPSHDVWTRGPIIMRPPSLFHNEYVHGGIPIIPETPSNTLKDYGQRAINQLAPTVSAAQLTRALGELALAPPQLPFMGWPNTIDTSKYVGDQWLNAAFGIIPTITDIKSIVQNLKNRSRLIKQLMRDSDKVVRRRFSFPGETTSEVSTYETTYDEFIYPPGGYDAGRPYIKPGTFDNTRFSASIFPPAKGPEPIVLTKTTTTSRDIWFSGAFTYHIPKDDSLLSELERLEAKANVLLGTRFTPSTFWELTPWSWLVDWNLKIGQALKSADALSTYGLVLKYGYLMCHTRKLESVTSPRIELCHYGSTVWVQPTGYMIRSERKERIRADPYGFAVAPADYTDSQWAILGALLLGRGGGATGQQG